MKPVIPNRMRIDQTLKLIDAMTVDERRMLFEKLDVIFRSPVDRVFAEIEKMNDEEREELFDLTDDTYCQECGAVLPEDEMDHECPYDEEEVEPGEDGEDGEDANALDYDEGDEADEAHLVPDTSDEGEPT